MATNGTTEPSVVHLDPTDNGVYELTSLCMSCHSPDGQTRILPIKIPYFREVLLESFSCDECGFKNNTVKSAGEIQPKGAKYTFRIDGQADFERQVVRSDNGIFRIVDLDLEMPKSPGQYTTLESMFNRIFTDLSHDQPLRKIQSPDLYEALERIIQRLQDMMEGKAFPITVSLEDPSGNSFITPSQSDKGDKYGRVDFVRTHEQNVELGLAADDDTGEDQTNLAHRHVNAETTAADPLEGVDIVDGEVYEFPAECPACTKPCSVNMKRVNIPHFKEVIIMATVCESCGYRTSDVKTGGAIPEKGKKITLLVKNKTDLSRDILKSESCELHSSDLGLEVQPGTLGGRFTTVEGLLSQVRDQLHGQIFDIDAEDGLKPGDSMEESTRTTWTAFFAKLDQALRAEIEFSITLTDPLANSFVQKNTDGDEADPQITIEEYQRTDEEEDELGLKHMKLEDYEEDEKEEDESDKDDMPALLPAQEDKHILHEKPES